MGTYYMPDTVLGLGVYRVVEKMLPVQTSKRKKKGNLGTVECFIIVMEKWTNAM